MTRRYNTVLFVVIITFTACISSKDSVPVITKKAHLSHPNKEISLKRNFHNGAKEKILGNYDLAANYFNKCLKIDGNHAASMYELASIYEYQGSDELALNFSEKSVSIDPENEWYRMMLANLYNKQNRFKDAAQVYQELAVLRPYKIEYLYNKANSLIFGGDLKKAIVIYDQIEEKIGVNERVSEQKERLYLKLGEDENAIREVEKLIQSNPKEARYYGMLAELYQIQGKEEKALEVYQELIEIDPENPHIHLSLADYYRAAGDDKRAFEELKIAFGNPDLDIDSKVQILLNYYALTEVSDNKLEEAFLLSEQLVIIHPDNAKSHSIYGDFLYREDRLDEARNSFRKAIALDKTRFAIWNQVLIIDEELQDFSAMLQESEQAIELFPNQPILYLFNGLANMRKKKYDKAVQALNLGVSYVVDNSMLLGQFYANLGDAHHNNKNYTESDIAYDRALKINPNNVFVLNNYSYFLSIRGDSLEKAEEMSKRSIELEPNSPSFLDTYSWILYQMGRYEDAKIWIQKAVETGGNSNGVILEHYGDILFKLKEEEKALNYWKKAKQEGRGSELLDKKIEDKKLHE